MALEIAVMARVLIPFSDGASGERAVRRLLARPRDPRLEVELLAIVDPLTSGKVAVFVSHERASAQSSAAAQTWLASLTPMLDAAHIPWRSQIAVGRRRAILQRAGARRDIDEVLLGTRARDPFSRWRRRLVAQAMARPLVSVS
jgi:nucleotide-binding universal stress UspA family protein